MFFSQAATRGSCLALPGGIRVRDCDRCDLGDAPERLEPSEALEALEALENGFSCARVGPDKFDALE